MYRVIAKFEDYDVVEHVKMEEYKQAQREKTAATETGSRKYSRSICRMCLYGRVGFCDVVELFILKSNIVS